MPSPKYVANVVFLSPSVSSPGTSIDVTAKAPEEDEG